MKQDEMGVAYKSYGSYEKAIYILVEKPDGKGPVERPTCRRENNIKTNLIE
jgi:hypothetical protein